MKHKALATIMFAAALSQIACDNKPSASDCVADPACRAGVLASAGPQLFPLSAPAAAQVPGAMVPGAPLTNQPFRISSALAKAGVTDGALKAQSAKVAAAIAADDQNPLSTYYKSPTPDVPKATTEAPAAVTRSTASTASIEPIPQISSASDTGEAAR